MEMGKARWDGQAMLSCLAVTLRVELIPRIFWENPRLFRGDGEIGVKDALWTSVWRERSYGVSVHSGIFRCSLCE